MTGLILGICDVHIGLHSEGDSLGKPCVGWMMYEPIGSRSTSDYPTSESRMSEPVIEPGWRPEAVSELDDEPSQMEILVTPDMLREIAEDLEREGDNFCRTLQTTTGEFIDLRNMSVECSACGDSLDVRDADDKMRCEPCHDADVTHDEQGNQITPV